MSESFDLGEPGRFTVGAIGEPGRRVFYFQAFGDGVEASVKCEKQQAQALADHLIKLLDDLPPFVPAEVPPPRPCPRRSCIGRSAPSAWASTETTAG